jgi:nicotinamidase-related amidase
MQDFKFPYKLDKDGPRGISVESWLDKEKLGLVLNDFQNFCTVPLYGEVWNKNDNGYFFKRYREVVLPNTLKLLKRSRELGIRIIYTRLVSFQKDLSDIPGIARKALALDLKDTENKPYHLYDFEFDGQISDEVKPEEPDIIISKTSSGVFNSSDIDNILRNNGISALIFTGGITDACLSSSVRGAYDRGYLCTVAEDACISDIETDHKYAIRLLSKHYAWVTDTDTILNYLG